MRLLVVDDDTVFREEFCDVLEGEGHQVEGAASVRDAVSRLASGAFAAVFTDLRMPTFSGFDLLKEIRRKAPSTHSIIVTGQADEVTALQALQEGALDVLGKPFDFARLHEVLSSIEEQRAYRNRIAPPRSTGAVVAELRARGSGVAILGPGHARPEWAEPIPLDAGNPWPAVTLARAYADAHPDGAVVLRIGRELLGGIGPSPTGTLVAKLRAALPPSFRVWVGVDGLGVADDAVMALRAALASQAVPPSLSPAVLPELRRLVQRLAVGPGGGYVPPTRDSSPAGRRTDFLMHRLEAVGWAAPSGLPDPLTAEGRRVAALLEALGSGAGSTALGDGTYTLEPEEPPLGRPAS